MTGSLSFFVIPAIFKLESTVQIKYELKPRSKIN